MTKEAVWLLVPEAESLGTADARVLLLEDEADEADAPGRRGLGLPRLTVPHGTWVPEGVGSLSEQAEARLGVRATVLRHLADQDGWHVCEAEGACRVVVSAGRKPVGHARRAARRLG